MVLSLKPTTAWFRAWIRDRNRRQIGRTEDATPACMDVRGEVDNLGKRDYPDANGNQPLPAVRFEGRQGRGGRRRRLASHDSQPRAAGGLAGITATSNATLSSPRNIKTSTTMGAKRNHVATRSNGAPACIKSMPINVDVARANIIRSQAALEFKNVIVPRRLGCRQSDTREHRWLQNRLPKRFGAAQGAY